MRISILGCGWYGSELAGKLILHHQVAGTSRNISKLQELKQKGLMPFELSSHQTPASELMNGDVLVLNVPPQESHLDWFKFWPLNKNIHLIFISSTSIYGDHQGEVNELTTPAPDSLGGKILIEQEEWVRTFPRHTIIRFGGLLGKERHPGKYLSGRKDLPNGNWPVNLVHLDDCVGFTELVIEKKLSGTFNLVSDLHHSRKDYYTEYCSKQGLPLPSFIDSDVRGKVVSNSKVKKIYQLKRPMLD